MKRAGEVDLSAALSGEARKYREQRQNCKATDFDFVPLTFEATGGHSKKEDQVAHYLLQQKQIYLGVPSRSQPHASGNSSPSPSGAATPSRSRAASRRCTGVPKLNV